VALLDDLEAQLCLDTQRVYATGISNGGVFLYARAPGLGQGLGLGLGLGLGSGISDGGVFLDTLTPSHL
jgi:hypothetical protein